jgi:hypothetical protein
VDSTSGHGVPADVDVWMVVHELGLMADLIDEVPGPRTKSVSSYVAMIAGSAVSARCQFGKPVSCWDTSESVNRGLIAHSQRGIRDRCQGRFEWIPRH